MKLKLFFSILSIVFATTADDHWHHSMITSPTVTNTPTPCIVGGVSVCPAGAICTQTMTCGGLCLSVYTPSFVPCIAISGAGTPCPTGSTCVVATSEFCFPDSHRGCSGQCMATPGPSVSCIPGVSSKCPSGSSCAPITTTPGSPCGGQCVKTQALPSVPCILGGPSVCGANSICTQTETCSGQCLVTGVLNSTSSTHYIPSPTPSSYHHKGDHK